MKSKNIDKVKQGKKAHRAGSDFEARVFKDLWFKGKICTKWNNNLNDNFDIVQAKQGLYRRTSNGFPDFCYYDRGTGLFYGVECKTNNRLSKAEKHKCEIYLRKKIFNEIFIASKEIVKGKIKINYERFSKKQARAQHIL